MQYGPDKTQMEYGIKYSKTFSNDISGNIYIITRYLKMIRILLRYAVLYLSIIFEYLLTICNDLMNITIFVLGIERPDKISVEIRSLIYTSDNHVHKVSFTRLRLLPQNQDNGFQSCNNSVCLLDTSYWAHALRSLNMLDSSNLLST